MTVEQNMYWWVMVWVDDSGTGHILVGDGLGGWQWNRTYTGGWWPRWMATGQDIYWWVTAWVDDSGTWNELVGDGLGGWRRNRRYSGEWRSGSVYMISVWLCMTCWLLFPGHILRRQWCPCNRYVLSRLATSGSFWRLRAHPSDSTKVPEAVWHKEPERYGICSFYVLMMTKTILLSSNIECLVLFFNNATSICNSITVTLNKRHGVLNDWKLYYLSNRPLRLTQN